MAGGGYRIVTELYLPDGGDSASLVAWPAQMTMEWTLPDNDPSVHLQFQWFGKPANRLLEALWLSLVPLITDTDGWRLDKEDQSVAPRDVVSHGWAQPARGHARGVLSNVSLVLAEPDKGL